MSPKTEPLQSTNITMPFRRPVGAPIDVKELEYIAALHQTCLPICRENATVSSIDVVRYLRSRFGLGVTHHYALEVVRGLGGGVIGEDVIQRILEEVYVDEEEDEEVENGNANLNFIKGAGAGVGNRFFALKKKLFKAESEKLIQEAKEEQFSEEETRSDVRDTDDVPEEYLDLVQLLSIILMPTIARAGKEFRDSLNMDVDQEEEIEEEESGYSFNPIVIYKRYRAYCREKKDRRAQEEYESLRPKPEGLLGDVLHMLLGTLYDRQTSASGSDASGSDTSGHSQLEIKEKDYGPTLNAGLVETLLEAWGEHERAKDTELVNAMVEAAGGPGVTLDEASFVSALTSDLSEWKVGVEDRLSTVHFDVWNYDSIHEKQRLERQKLEKKNETDTTGGSKEAIAEKGQAGTDTNKESFVPQYPPAAFNIDFAVDCHGSVALTAIIWVFFVATALVYAILFQDMAALQPSCDDTFGCKLANTVITWMILAVILSVTGILVIVPLGLANTPVTTSPKYVVFSFLLGAVYTYLPYMVIVWYRDQSEKPYNDAEATVNDVNYENTQKFTFAIGNALLFAFLVQFIVTLVGRRAIRQGSDIVKRVFTSSNVRGSYRTKKAATRKINAMLKNAHSLHPGVRGGSQSKSILSSLRGSSATEETMLNFVLRGEKYEDCGGLFWTWKRICNTELFDTEGVWINSRIYVIQTAQVVLGVIVAFSALVLTEILADAAEDATNDLDNYEDLPQWVHDIVPTREQVYAAFYPATGVLIIVMVAIILIYLPSAAGTTLQYRCGLKPTLTSKLFNVYRGNPDTVYLNIGNAIYAMVGSAVLFFLLVALAVFLLVWDFTRDFMVLLIAWGLGLTITIVLKMVLTMLCRKKFYAGYYRTKPFSANLSLLALECWFIGLGGGILLGRFTQFLLAAAFWVGRIDVRFLDENVNLVGYGFDYVPFNFEKDLLGHDAHRHPYIERLGCMYMMKLKHGKKFCSDAGACWRQLFVVALMPWMMKSRVLSDKRLSDAMEAFAKKKKEEKERKKTFAIVDNAIGLGDDLVTGLKTGGMGYSPDEAMEELADENIRKL